VIEAAAAHDRAVTDEAAAADATVKALVHGHVSAAVTAEAICARNATTESHDKSRNW
jgi:hypothetical protein